MADLKPCPFCGGENITVITTIWGVKVECFVCGANVGSSKGKGSYKTLNSARKHHYKKAVIAWERRYGGKENAV